jgi:hypothetical protein
MWEYSYVLWAVTPLHLFLHRRQNRVPVDVNEILFRPTRQEY